MISSPTVANANTNTDRNLPPGEAFREVFLILGKQPHSGPQTPHCTAQEPQPGEPYTPRGSSRVVWAGLSPGSDCLHQERSLGLGASTATVGAQMNTQGLGSSLLLQGSTPH